MTIASAGRTSPTISDMTRPIRSNAGITGRVIVAIVQFDMRSGFQRVEVPTGERVPLVKLRRSCPRRSSIPAANSLAPREALHERSRDNAGDRAFEASLGQQQYHQRPSSSVSTTRSLGR
jgi:hypothetical protein